MTETAVEQVIIIANCVVNLALAFVAIFANALVLYGVWKTPSLRSPFILLLCSLASTDFSVGFIAQPMFIATSFVGLFSRSVNLKLIFIKIHSTIAFCLCGGSLAMTTGISIDRLIAIHKPPQYPSIVTSSRVTRILVAIWIVSILAASSEFWETRVLFGSVYAYAWAFPLYATQPCTKSCAAIDSRFILRFKRLTIEMQEISL